MSPTMVPGPMSPEDAARVHAACEAARPQFEQMHVFEKFVEGYRLGRARIAIDQCAPTVDFPNNGIIEYRPSGRIGVSIVGDEELVRPYLQAIAEVMAAERIKRPDVYRP